MRACCRLIPSRPAACANHDLRATGLLEPLLGRYFAPVVAAFQHHDALPWIGSIDLITEHLNAAQIRGENHDLFVWILSPEHPKGVDQLLNLCFDLAGEGFQKFANS